MFLNRLYCVHVSSLVHFGHVPFPFPSLNPRTRADIHMRARDGKGSFNWRMKFPLELPLAATLRYAAYMPPTQRCERSHEHPAHSKPLTFSSTFATPINK